MRRFLALLAVVFALATPAYAQVNRVYLTSGTTWTVPQDWNSQDNVVEIVGSGGRNGARPGVPGDTVAGGGGAYAAKINVPLTPGATINVHFGGDADLTWFVDATTVAAQDGFNGANVSNPGGGGDNGASVGDVRFSGGQGGIGNSTSGPAGAGGAAGPHGNGGFGEIIAKTGGDADAGFGGAGGTPGNPGGAGTEFDASHGAGGGAGGSTASAGGLYGGGSSNSTRASGLIVITWESRRRVSSGVF